MRRVDARSPGESSTFEDVAFHAVDGAADAFEVADRAVHLGVGTGELEDDPAGVRLDRRRKFGITSCAFIISYSIGRSTNSSGNETCRRILVIGPPRNQAPRTVRQRGP